MKTYINKPCALTATRVTSVAALARATLADADSSTSPLSYSSFEGLYNHGDQGGTSGIKKSSVIICLRFEPCSPRGLRWKTDW